ncbi:MAG: DUF4445 domain-containing protein [Ruminococcaceae bacterium]|nr:DUF4445 domain-containing protein [Oscillospiraceae bacterium]
MLIKNSEKKLLWEVLAHSGMSIDKPCGGNGTCGKCKVKASGNLLPMSETESMLLSDEEKKNGIRLACRAFALGDVEVCGLYRKGLNDKDEAQFYCSEDLNNVDKCIAAIDLGTTVIEAKFYTPDAKKLLKHGKMINPQGKFGADVISRIMFSKNEDGKELLKNELSSAILELSGDLYEKIEYSVVAGNTAMLHFYSGLDACSIASYPFKPKTLFGSWNENVYIPRCISAYVGADTTLAILSSGMLLETPSLLVDIGTNGEIALCSGEKLYVSSAAAGPAFEGASISHGMFAINGAINHVSASGSYETVGGEPPKGICASGLIDAVCYMLNTGKISKDGYLEKEFEIDKSSVFISPQDIRNFQLGKAAIRAGIETLLDKANISAHELKRLYIAGALGKNADIENCKKIGLIPKIEKEKIILLSNAALRGASMILEDRENIKITEEIAKKGECIELSLCEEFTKKYIEYMSF